MLLTRSTIFLIGFLIVAVTNALVPSTSLSSSEPLFVDRRCAVSHMTGSVSLMLLWQGPADALAIDSKEQPAEFRNVGTQAPPPDGDMPFVTLDNGVKVKDFRVGNGDDVVGPSSRVDI